ncbi:MAG: hypothetical protein ABIP48_00900 [Planctomycetota bacterium]
MTLDRTSRDELLDALKQSFDDAMTAKRKRVNRQVSMLQKMAEGYDLGAVQDNVLCGLGEHAVDNIDVLE